jgi:hypothetical protein
MALTWYSNNEIALIKAECVHTVEMMIDGKYYDTQGNDAFFETCSRGLEYRTPAGAQPRQKDKTASWHAVEEEQNRQWQHHHGIIDAEGALALVYGDCTQHCSRAAHMCALRDEKCVQGPQHR